MNLAKHLRFLVPCLGWAALGLVACELAVGNSELTGVQCDRPGQVGAPSCGEGQICANGVCTACLTGERCTNGVDDDCNGLIDDSCGSGGKDGGASGKDGGETPDVSVTDGDTGVATGGAGGVAGSAGAGGSVGGAGGQGGSAGSAGSSAGGSGGAGGNGGTGGSGGEGGTAGSGATGGAGGAGGAGGTGGTEPSCIANDQDCDNSKPWECCTKYCCLTVKYGKCGKGPNVPCTSHSECCLGVCQGNGTCL